MKKLFFFIPALLLSLLANAARQTISPSSDESDSNIRSALSGSADTIILNAGNYKEADQIHFRRNAVIMAAEGAEVIITPKYYCDLVYANTKVKIIGIKFDGSVSGQQAIRVYDDNAGKELRLENCEFYNFAKDVITCDDGTRTIDSCIINNCYFHDNNYSPIYFNKSSVEGKQTIYGLIVKNSTFANNDPSKEYRSVIDVQSYNREATDDIEVLIDHCTFYNNTTLNYDYSAVRTRIVNRTTVSNCIFAHPSAIEFYATNVWAGSVTNCLAYNFNKGYSAPTKTNANTGNPLFTDAASGDFSLAGNWVTMALSPARGAATDGSDLGDPRWYSAETLPSVDFATPYQFVGAKALLAGKIWYDSENDYLYGDGGSNKDYGTATWKFHAEKAGVVGVAANLNSGNTSGHKLRVEVLDADGNSVGEFAEQTSTLPGTLIIPAAGDYKIILHDDQTWSSAKIDNVTLSYIGGAVQNIASATNTTVNVSEAWYSAGGSRADGKISFPGDLIATSWIRWNVHVADSKYYDITVNFSSDNGHNIGIRLFNDERSIEISEGGQTSAASPLELGRLSIPAGDYTMELTNPVSHSHAQIISVLFAPVAASATELPGTLEFGNAVLSDRAHVTDGNLYFAPIGDTNPAGEWAAWAVTTDHNGTFLFTLDTYSSNGQSYKISIYGDGDNLIDSFEKKLSSGVAGTIKHYFVLASGSYSVKVENTTAWSRGYLTSFVVTEPSLLTLNDTDESNSTISDNYRTGALDIKISRTIVAGMYNTICLPFDVDATILKEVFGNDVNLREMSSATIEGEVLSLNFNASTSIYRGTPYLIKTSSNIVDPIFVDVVIKEEVGQASGEEEDVAEFIGTFIKKDITANENNLFLGSENKLYFSTEDVTIKGFRGYFNITAAAGAPKRARLVMDEENIATEIELINGQLPEIFGKKVLKTIDNGQLLIIRDGAYYNVMGQIVK